MARRVIYQTNEAYNIGYNDGWKDAIDKACVAIHNMMVDGVDFCLDDNDYIMQIFRKVVEGKA